MTIVKSKKFIVSVVLVVLLMAVVLGGKALLEDMGGAVSSGISFDMGSIKDAKATPNNMEGELILGEEEDSGGFFKSFSKKHLEDSVEQQQLPEGPIELPNIDV